MEFGWCHISNLLHKTLDLHILNQRNYVIPLLLIFTIFFFQSIHVKFIILSIQRAIETFFLKIGKKKISDVFNSSQICLNSLNMDTFLQFRAIETFFSEISLNVIFQTFPYVPSAVLTYLLDLMLCQ